MHKNPENISVRKAVNTGLGLKVLISSVKSIYYANVLNKSTEIWAVLLNEEQRNEMMFSVWPSYVASKYIETSNTSCEPFNK